MKRTSGLLCWFVIAAVHAGCGGCGGGGGGNNSANNGGEVDTRGFRQVLANMCDYMERCPSDNYAIAYRNRGECVDILDFVLTCRVIEEGEDDNETYTVQQIPVSISQSQKQACIDWLDTVSCGEQLSGEDNPCVFLGAAFDDDDNTERGALRGEVCNNQNCIEGLECVNSAQSTEETEYCRICVAPGGPGSPCVEPNRPCQEGLTCNWELGLCDYPLDDGDDCENSPRPCREGAFCDYEDRTCKPLLAAGESCLYEDRGFGQFCESQFCNDNTGKCDDAGHDGDPCENQDDCHPYESLRCEEGTCRGPRLNGESCTENQQCQSRQCDMATSKCGLPDGSECRDDGDCQSNNCGGRSFDGICEQPRELGESCDNGGCRSEYVCAYDSDYNYQSCRVRCEEDADCPDEHRCDGEACQPVGPDGSRCRYDEDCQSGWCNDSADVCATKPKIGDACQGYGECYPRGYCSGGVCKARRGPGDSCEGLDSCLEPYICLEGKCERISLSCRPAQPGEMCTWLRVCDETAYCDLFDNFTCKARKTKGSSCNRSEECASGLVCEYTTEGGICGEPAGVGDDCSSRECGAELFCDRNTRTCAEFKDPGEPCDDEDECSGDAYCDGACQLNNPEPQCVLPEDE